MGYIYLNVARDINLFSSRKSNLHKNYSDKTLKEKNHPIKPYLKGEYSRIVWYVGEKIEKFLLPLSYLFFR